MKRKAPQRAQRKLGPNQRRFVEEYLLDLNATQAAIRAGYSAKTARSQGQRLLTIAAIVSAIADAEEKRSERTNVKADAVVRELKLIAHSDIGDILDFTGDEPRLRVVSEISEAARRAISSVKVRRYIEGHGEDARTVEVTEFKLWPKPEALRDLGNHLGLFKNPLASSLDECRRLLARMAGIPEADLPVGGDALR